MRYEPTGIDRFVRFDPAISRTHRFEHVPSFTTVYIRLLQRGDNEAAEFARAHVEGEDLRSVRDSQIPLVMGIDAGRPRNVARSQ